MDRRFGQASRALFAEMFPPEPDTDPRVSEIGRDFAFALMEGVALGRLVPQEHSRPAADYINALKRVAHRTVTSLDAS